MQKTSKENIIRKKGISMNKTLLVIVIALIGIGAVGGVLWVSASNREVGLRNRASAQQSVCKMVYDETWKIISQKGQVTSQYKDDFKDIFSSLMEGRYGNEKGGSLMKWIQEHNPNFDASMYKSIQTSIEEQRHKFTEAQKMLQDIKLQHDNMRTQYLDKLFVGSRPELEITIVTSSKTEDIFKSAKEDDISVFGEKK